MARTQGTDRARKNGGLRKADRDLLRRTQGPLRSKPPSATPTPAPQQLMDQAETLLQRGQPADALPLALQPLSLLQQSDPANTNNPTPASLLPAHTLLASIYLELGDLDQARSHCQTAIHLAPDASAEPYLNLAQLSEHGGQESIDFFTKAADILRRDLAIPTSDHAPKLASTLCAMVEVYMTDLSWEASAESACESLVSEALLVAPSSPEPLQTLASVRISQSRIPEAKSALRASMELWAELQPEDSRVPDFPTRISLARLLLEVGMEAEGLGVLERLVTEDDQSVEAWYLGGWCLYLLGMKGLEGGKDGNAEASNDADGLEETGTAEGAKAEYIAAMVSSREWLRQSLTLYEMLEYEDDRLRDHALELVGALDKELDGVDVDALDGEEEEEVEWESGSGEEEEEEEEDDEEMDGV